MRDYKDLSNAIITGKKNEAVELCNIFLDEGKSAEDIIKYGLVSGMDVIGQRFKADEIFVPEVLISARAMQESMDVVKPHLESDVSAEGKLLIGTVKGDLHDIGKNLVSMMFKGAGFEVIDIGVNIPAEKFAKKVEEHRPDLLGMSALLTTTLSEMRNVIEVLKEKKLRNKVNIIIGGAPVTNEFKEEIGADAYAPDGSRAVDAAKELLK